MNFVYTHLLMVSLVSCKNKNTIDPEIQPEDTDTLTPLDIDNDGDGVSENEGDCDDANGDIYPDALEVCDDIDNDCDGDIDDEDDNLDTSTATKYYNDDDGDGYGDESVFVWSCDELDDHVFAVGDCNDDNASVNPEALELCDDIDNDCDGYIDDEDTNLADGDLYYEDQDDDGYGDPGMSTLACIQPNGYILDNTDCDDTNPNLYPLDGDGDGLTLCDADCDDSDSTVGATDFDQDGSIACVDDCDDTNPLLNRNDTDGDGLSTCEGDCNDFDPLILDVDADGDGFSACYQDCDDSDPYISPLLDEDGDGIHACLDCDDYNGSIGGYITGYTDSDSDGFGAFEAHLVCSLDEDGDGVQEYTTTFGDCNDFDADTHPGAASLDSGSSCLQDSDSDGYGVSGACLSFSLYDTDDGWDSNSTLQVYVDGIWDEDLQLDKGIWDVAYRCYPTGSVIDIGYLSGPNNSEQSFAIYNGMGQIQYHSIIGPDRVEIAIGDLPIISLSPTESGGSDSNDQDADIQ